MHICFNSTCCAFKENVMFKVGQKVWCAIYGAGVVTEIRQEEVDYPVVAVFNCNDERTATVTYTADGKYHEASNVTLFPYPVEITKAVTKPSINWSHVNENYKYLAMDEDGLNYLFTEEPVQAASGWTSNAPYIYAGHFASIVPGTCDWKDSLVKRPKGEAI